MAAVPTSLLPAQSSKLDRDGYLTFSRILSNTACENLLVALPQLTRAGTRNLLARPPFAALAQKLSRSRELRPLLDKLKVVQGILFRKDLSKNWLVKLHRDCVIPVAGDGTWPSAGYKEGLHYARPPFEFLSRCVVVRVALNDVPEGDIHVVAGSHTRAAQIGVAKATRIVVPKGGAIAMRPTLLHGSAKLTHSPARNVVHYLFAPSELPGGHWWQSPSGSDGA